MLQIEVNKPFPFPLLTKGAIFEWRGRSSPMLILHIDEPTKREIKGLKAKSEFCLAYVNELIFLLVRASNNAIQWSEAPFSVRIYKDSDKPDIPHEISEESRLLLMLIVVDARNRHVKMFKQCTLSPAFTRKLYQLIARQRSAERQNWNYDLALYDVFARYTPEQLAKQAIVKCFAGD